MTGELIEPELKSYWVGNENTELSANPRFVNYFDYNDYIPICIMYDVSYLIIIIIITCRTHIDISNSDLPTKSTTPSEPDMSSNKYLTFTHSSIDRDVAQTTLPFIDMQIVAPYPGIPFSGLGIYFKGTKGYGGFIGANIFTYDLTNNINSKLFSFHAI